MSLVNRLSAMTLGLGLLLLPLSQAAAQNQVTYLLPAPQYLPAFAPMNLAQTRGYFAEEGLEVEFIAVRGGAEVATMVGAGNALLGGGIGDTPIIVRANGVPIRSVAVLGGGALTTVVARADAGIESLEDLAGRKVSVVSFQDTTYYSLLGSLGAVGLSDADVEIEAHGPAGVWQMLVEGAVDAASLSPDWIVNAEQAGLELRQLSSADIFPSMAQAIIAADSSIEAEPEAIRGFVAAVLRAIGDIVDDPEAAAADLIAFNAAQGFPFPEEAVLPTLERFTTLVYSGQDVLGAADPDRIARVQDFYLEAGIIRTASPVEDLYTTEFLP